MTWRTRLSADEIRRTRDDVAPISKEFYADVDW